MNTRSISLRILWWSEIIISARILFFSIPVLIQKNLERSFSPIKVDDWFVIILTSTALIYLLVGYASITGHRLWKFFHYLAAALIFLLSVGLWNLMISTTLTFEPFYFLPALFAVGIALFIGTNTLSETI